MSTVQAEYLLPSMHMLYARYSSTNNYNGSRTVHVAATHAASMYRKLCKYQHQLARRPLTVAKANVNAAQTTHHPAATPATHLQTLTA
jgi:hypothetical protein